MEKQYLQVRQTQSMGKGVFANDDIPSQTIILIIDESKFITYQQIRQHYLFYKLEDETDDKAAQFAYLLSYHQNLGQCQQCECSQLRLADYVKTLPAYFNNLICWDDDELQQLKNNELIKKIRGRKQQIKKIYQKILDIMLKQKQQVIEVCELKQEPHQKNQRGSGRKCVMNKGQVIKNQQKLKLTKLKQISFEQLLKFIACIESRNAHYQTTFDTQSNVGALIPFLEMFNHSKNPQCKVQLTTTSYKVMTTRDIKKGEQIFVNYRTKFQLQDFLQYYGMIPEEEIVMKQKENVNLFSQYLKNIKQKIQFQSQDNNIKIKMQRNRLANTYNFLYQKNKSGNKKTSKSPLSERNYA